MPKVSFLVYLSQGTLGCC